MHNLPRTLQIGLPAAALAFGLVSNVSLASANEPNPLLKNSTGITMLNKDQMNGVQGSGAWANYYGSLGLSYSQSAYSKGYYARWTAPTNSSTEQSYYYSASGDAHT